MAYNASTWVFRLKVSGIISKTSVIRPNPKPRNRVETKPDNVKENARPDVTNIQTRKSAKDVSRMRASAPMRAYRVCVRQTANVACTTKVLESVLVALCRPEVAFAALDGRLSRKDDGTQASPGPVGLNANCSPEETAVQPDGG